MRPCLPYEYDSYLPSQKRRFITLPGLTGLWQVSGKNKTTFSEMIALDVRYAETKSPWLDLKIMLKTFPALLSQVIESRFKKRAEALPSRIDQELFDSVAYQTGPDESPNRAAIVLQENSGRMEIVTTAHAEN